MKRTAVIGAGAAGCFCAAELRRLRPDIRVDVYFRLYICHIVRNSIICRDFLDRFVYNHRFFSNRIRCICLFFLRSLI